MEKITKHGKIVQYKKEDLSQVNRQLYEWLAIVNEKSSNDSIPENSENVNKNSENNVDERLSKKTSNKDKFTIGRKAATSLGLPNRTFKANRTKKPQPVRLRFFMGWMMRKERKKKKSIKTAKKEEK